MDKIKELIAETQTYYNQTSEEISDWRAAEIREFARNYETIRSSMGVLRQSIQDLTRTMNKFIIEGTISSLCWKLGKMAIKNAEEESERLLRLIRSNNKEIVIREISMNEKSFKVSSLREMVESFNGECLRNTRTFQQFKEELESSLSFYQVDRREWGFYAKFLLEGEAKETLEREMHGQSNPDYEELMMHLQKHHGKVSEVLRAVKRRQLILENITPATQNARIKEICRIHRTCFNKISEILKTNKEYAGAVREHLINALLKFPDYHRRGIKELLEDKERN